MSIEGLGITLLILALSIAYMAQPFFRRAAAPKNEVLQQQKERDALLTTYERILTTIRDIDEDYQLGKLPQEAYAELREQWAERGAAVLEALDKLDGHKAKKKKKTEEVAATDADAALDEAIEQAIANYVKAKSNSGN
jgi:hypothetical protein